MSNRNVARWALLAALVALCVAVRLLSDLPNFAPVAAAALFAATVTGRRTLGALVALSAMLIGDAFVGAYSTPVMVAVYGALAAPALLGPVLRRRSGALPVVASAAGAGVLFFAVSNLAVWAFGGLYPMSAEGLGACYLAALPFFKYTLAGNLFWSATFFGAYALTRATSLSLRPAGR